MTATILMKIRKKLVDLIDRIREIQVWDRATWEEAFSSGSWDYLNSAGQLPRYSIIESWRQQYRPTGSILDVGCGEGIVLSKICPTAKIRYLGIDISQVALNRAKKRIKHPELEDFVCCDLKDFFPSNGELFDLIVFNEVLYFSPDYLDILEKFKKYSRPKGLFITSLANSKPRTWKIIHNRYKNNCLQALGVKMLNSNKGWNLGIYQF